MKMVGEASNATEAIEGINKLKPDLVIADISLDGTSGLELTKIILSSHPELLVLIVSMYDESVYVERVLNAGAKGYLTKRETSEHIVKAIRKLLKGDVYLSDKWRDKLLHKYVGRANNDHSATGAKLSERELEVLHLTGQGYSTRRVGETLHVSIKTVESHYANIKNKLDLKNSHELIQYAVTWCLSERHER